jgi:hypothetical protein
MSSAMISRREQAAFADILAIVRAAMRDAVVAPSDRESLDVAGAALVAVARRVRTEVGRA